MADYSALLNLIDTTITSNGQGDITGAILNNTLKAIVNSLGAGYQFMGVATPATNPGTPDQKVFYLATTAGVYTNFNNITLTHGLWILRYDTTWHYDNIMFIDNELSASSTNPVENATLKAAIDGLAELIQGQVESPLQLTYTTGYYIAPGGNKASFSGGYITNPIHVSKGDIVNITAKANSGVCIIATTDAQGSSYTPKVIGTGSTSSTTLQTVSYTATEDCYLAFSALNAAPTGTIVDYYIRKILEKLDLCLNQQDDINHEIYGETSQQQLSLTSVSGYYLGPAGNKAAFSSGYITNPIAVQRGQTVRITAVANSGVCIIALTDAQGSFYTPKVVGTGSTSSASSQTVEYTATEDCYLAFSAITAAPTGTITVITYEGILDRLSAAEDDIEALQSDIASAFTDNLLCAFDNLVCVGDSLTYSQVYTAASTSRQAFNPYPKVLARLCGNDYTLLATPGWNAKQVWDNYKTSIVSKSHALGIVYLGTNDGLTDTLSTDVVGDDPDAWANNNIGCYCRIVQKMISLGYRVLLVRCWATSGTGDSNLTNTNNAIQHVAERFGCAMIKCPMTSDVKYHYYPDLSGYNQVHYNDLGYSWFAAHLINAVAHLERDYMKYLIPA